MVGIGTALIGLGALVRVRLVAKTRHPEDALVPARRRVSGVAAIVAMECGWIVTEVGRQPWIVHGVMRTEDAVTGASGVWLTLLDRARPLRGARDGDRAHPAHAWRGAGASEGLDAVDVPYGPERGRRQRPAGRGGGMSKADVVARRSSGSARRSTPSSAAPTSAPGSGRWSPAAASAASGRGG